MKTMLTLLLILGAILGGGCSDNATKSQSTQAAAEAKVRADALKKEMETAPKVFSNRDIFKKNEPATQAPAPVKAEKR